MGPRTYANLHATSLNPEAHERTCGYWYTVTAGAMSHTAFATRAGLERWLWERNLTLAHELPEAGTWGSGGVVGIYRECMHMDHATFEAVLPVLATVVMSNGDYTLALIEEDVHGVRTVHSLNPNVRTRLVFDRKRTRELVS